MPWDFMEKQKLKRTVQVSVPKKESQPKRLATCNIKFGKINILSSKYYKGPKEGNLNLDISTIHILKIKCYINRKWLRSYCYSSFTLPFDELII